jgi:hypothetical protein
MNHSIRESYVSRETLSESGRVVVEIERDELEAIAPEIITETFEADVADSSEPTAEPQTLPDFIESDFTPPELTADIIEIIPPHSDESKPVTPIKPATAAYRNQAQNYERQAGRRAA